MTNYTHQNINNYFSNQMQNMGKKALTGLVAIAIPLLTTGCQNAKSIRDSDGAITPSAQKAIESSMIEQKDSYDRPNQEGVNSVPVCGCQF